MTNQCPRTWSTRIGAMNIGLLHLTRFRSRTARSAGRRRPLRGGGSWEATRSFLTCSRDMNRGSQPHAFRKFAPSDAVESIEGRKCFRSHPSANGARSLSPAQRAGLASESFVRRPEGPRPRVSSEVRSHTTLSPAGRRRGPLRGGEVHGKLSRVPNSCPLAHEPGTSGRAGAPPPAAEAVSRKVSADSLGPWRSCPHGRRAAECAP